LLTRSLIIAPQWIGDAVMSEPLLAQLAARGERLAVAALPWVAPVYRAMPQVDEVIELPFAHGKLDWLARRRIATKLAGRFDTAYVLPNSFKSALVPWFAGIAHRVGYLGEWRWGLLNKQLPNIPGRPPMVGYYSALAGRDATGAKPPCLRLDEATLAATCARYEVKPNAYWVFAPGAEYGPAKRWPATHYAKLARSLYGDSGQQVLLLGSSKETPLCESIAQAVPDGCRVMAGRTTLFDAMSLIAQARGMVSNDSGLMHVAAAFGIRQVAIFGSSSPEHTPPLNRKARVLWLKEELQLDCAPCFDRVCRFGHTRCLTELPPKRVATALAQTQH